MIDTILEIVASTALGLAGVAVYLAIWTSTWSISARWGWTAAWSFIVAIVVARLASDDDEEIDS